MDGMGLSQLAAHNTRACTLYGIVIPCRQLLRDDCHRTRLAACCNRALLHVKVGAVTPACLSLVCARHSGKGVARTRATYSHPTLLTADTTIFTSVVVSLH